MVYRVVIDTNVIVSALLQPLGPPARIFSWAIRGEIQLCISEAVYAEYEEVIRRPRLRRVEAVITGSLHSIRAASLVFRPAEPVRACTDSDDNIFLECAQAAEAAYLVTGNLKHFPSVWLDTQIVSPRHFLDINQ